MEAVEPFEATRGRLFGLAYRMLGSRADAQDIVQEAYVRWHEADQSDIRNAEAWLVATTTRLAIDRLRRLKTEREAYIGQWLPEPLMHDTPPPDRDAELASDLSIAFMVLLERLAPEERAAFLLHDVFDVGYAEIARILGKTETACRQTVSRARDRVRRDQKRFEATAAAKEQLLRRFTAAVEARDDQALLALFTPDAVWTADSGGRTPASPRPIVGVDRVVKLVLGIAQKTWGARRLEIGTVNGEPGLLVHLDDVLTAAMAIAPEGDRIAAFYVMLNPEKLGTEVPDGTTVG
jgi:RNA polymerase sigma-70 factor (ECF subfamily)